MLLALLSVTVVELLQHIFQLVRYGQAEVRGILHERDAFI
jgi:hypothetical protein